MSSTYKQLSILAALVALSQAVPAPLAPRDNNSNGNCPDLKPGGRVYTVLSGDTCNGLAQMFQLSTLQVVSSNSAACAALMPDMTLCLPPPCANYMVQSGDTCTGVAANNGISLSDFYGFNPDIENPGCTNLQIGANVCVSKPSDQPAANSHCATFDTAKQGDTCNQVAIRNNVTTAQFEQLNPIINAQCTNLLASQAYCVKPVSGTATNTGSNSAPSTTSSKSTASATAAPKCGKTQLINSGDTCISVASANKLALADFYKLNPTVNSSCTNLLAGQNYCVKAG